MRNFVTCTLNQVVRVIKYRRMRYPGHVACMGDMINAYKILIGKPEGKKLLGRPRCRWEDITVWEGVDWIHLAHGRYQWWALVNIAVNFRVP
jgi:hypothetical protein